MFAIIRPVLSWKALAFSLLSSLVLVLALACGPAASPVTTEPRESTSTPVADGIVQTPTEAATPSPTATPPPTSTATPERTGDIQATASDSRDTSESPAQSGGTSEDDQAPPIPDKGELKYPNLGSRLDELVASVEAGDATAEQAASGAAMHSGESVAVTIYLSGGVDVVVSFLEENGGDPRNVGEDYIEAYVPVILLGPVSEQPGVLRVREIVPPEKGQGG